MGLIKFVNISRYTSCLENFVNFGDIVIYRFEGSCIILCLEEIKDQESWIVEIDMRYKVVL